MTKAILLEDLESIDGLCIGMSSEAWEKIEEESFEIYQEEAE
jgi:hypothetical protein